MRVIYMLQRMDRLIAFQSKGTPEVFAARLNISVRTLYYYINILRDLGAEIKYNSNCCSYEYLIDHRLKIGY